MKVEINSNQTEIQRWDFTAVLKGLSSFTFLTFGGSLFHKEQPVKAKDFLPKPFTLGLRKLPFSRNHVL